MDKYLKDIEKLIADINKLPLISDENKKLLDKKFRLEYNYNSNHIEGNTLTYGETQLLLFFDKTEGNHEFREYQEMKAHDVAHKLIMEWARQEDFVLTEMHIKQLNEIILVQPYWKEAITMDGQSTRRLITVGKYKDHPNSVIQKNGERFDYTSPLDTPILMGELLAWYNEENLKNDLHPIQLAALLHYKFILIHPFDDGNGRVSRLLVNYVLYKNNLPPVIIKSKDKKQYLDALNKADTGNIPAFINYIVEQLIWSLDLTLKATKGESINEIGDLDKKLSHIQKERKIGASVGDKYSGRLAEEVLRNKLSFLFSKWEDQLIKFDQYFNDRVVKVSIDEKYKDIVIYDASCVYELYDEVIYPQNYNGEWRQYELNELAIEISYGCPINNPEDKSSHSGGSIQIKFHTNRYEIKVLNTNKSFYKSYSEELTEDEIELIIEPMGMQFLDYLENDLKLFEN